MGKFTTFLIFQILYSVVNYFIWYRIQIEEDYMFIFILYTFFGGIASRQVYDILKYILVKIEIKLNKKDKSLGDYYLFDFLLKIIMKDIRTKV